MRHIVISIPSWATSHPDASTRALVGTAEEDGVGVVLGTPSRKLYAFAPKK